MPDWVLAAVAAGAAALGGALAVLPHRDVRLRALDGEPESRRERAERIRAWGVARVGFGPASRRRREATRLAVIRALAALVAELEAGQLPGNALVRAGGESSPWPTATAAAGSSGDIADALDLDGRTSPVLRHLAACWRVGERSGAGLAASVSRLATSARAAEDIRAALEGQLAVPRATARMLALLPVIGIVFGTLLGADPLDWLTSSPPGRACLAGGALLTVAGLWWTGRIATSVERRL